MNIEFSPPDISELEIEEVASALRSGWITTGPRTKELEKEAAAFTGAERCVCLNSQTACAEIALRLLGIGEGDEVIVPAYTYTATASVVCHVGAKLVIADIAPDRPEFDYDALENAMTARTKVVIPVDIAGIPCDYNRIFGIVERKKALFAPKNAVQEAFGRAIVLADGAHSFGAARGGVPAGSLADFTAFSFHAVKNFTTAEGGALAWKKHDGLSGDEFYRIAQLYSLHGQSKDALAKTQIGAWEYDVMGPWYKCNMTDVAAAMGLAQMKRYPAMLARRREIIARYDSALRPLGIKTLDHYGADYSSSGHLYITRVPGVTATQRNEIIIRMAERGIACNVHYKPLPMLTAYKNLGFDIKDYPAARAFFENEITLPLHTLLTNEEVEYVIDNYSEIAKEYL